MLGMLVKKHILNTLKALDIKYNQALLTPNPLEPVYFSKLAILEYCGWIEESFDLIVRRSVKGRLKTDVFKNMLNQSVIENTYGFEYKKHFRPMLSRAIGLRDMEIVEGALIDKGQLDKLTSELDTIKKLRDNAAHTWINGTTMSYPAPSYIKTRFEIIYPIMKGIYSTVKRL